eukprot:TRINITY_DN66368_c0_g1_i1.p1 TRINITY_DN66368_c0_g1~~TRINITY_DN66368_c0_g1_i1.p1  ORF type:complete len:312 (-),score=18.12 TRINITY_DN66368_c0_g1_i1:28-963(-)
MSSEQLAFQADTSEVMLASLSIADVDQDLDVAALVTAATPSRLFPKLGVILFLIFAGSSACLFLVGRSDAEVLAWVLLSVGCGLLMLALCLWPCAHAAHRPLLQALKEGRGILGQWQYTVEEWATYTEQELGPTGAQTAQLKFLSCCTICCLSPTVALVVAGMVVLNKSDSEAQDNVVSFGQSYLQILMITTALMSFSMCIRCLRLKAQYRYATKNRRYCVIFRNGILFLGWLIFWNCRSCWFGSWSLRELELVHFEGDTRHLNFVLVQMRGRDRGRQTHREIIPVPGHVCSEELSRIAQELQVPLTTVRR